jgi:polyhydroxybutyrate depolymerase
MVAFTTIVGLSAMGCSGGASHAPPTPAGQPSPSADVVVGGDRPVIVHVPVPYDASRPAPLVIVLHGYTGTGRGIVDFLRLAPAAAARGYVYAAPDGTMDGSGNRFWNATDACCDFHAAGVDDVAYLAGLIAEIRAELAIDPKRIAFVGHSNGGFMSYRMACDEAGLVAAIVSLSGATFEDPSDCAPTEPVSVVQVHGTADDTIRYEGGEIDGVAYPGAPTTAESWATYDGCGMTSTRLSAQVDVDATLMDGGDPAEASVDLWSGCRSGTSVELWTFPMGGHVPLVSPAFADAVFDFLVEHPKP